MWGVLLPLTLCLSAAASQPVTCRSSEQCHGGYYCDVATGACKQCLLCMDFNREPPSTPVSCITTVSQCGVCLKGLEEPLSGDVQEPCVAGGGGAPAYIWLAAGGLVLFAALIATVYYVLRKKHINIFASTSTAVLAPRAEAPPSAPEAPPPYNSLYSPLRTEPPAPPAQNEDSERPFLKPGAAAAAAPAREAAGRQAANVFNNPNYVRGPHLPNSRYHSKPEPPPEPEAAADEDTMESPWTPADAGDNSPGESSASSSGEAAGAGASGLSAALAAARGAVPLRPPAGAAPPAKLPRLPQDTNNNGSSHREREDSAGAPSINILVNVQQISDVKL